jgi:hypothetical protein
LDLLSFQSSAKVTFEGIIDIEKENWVIEN